MFTFHKHNFPGSNSPRTDGSMVVEEEISDGELADLLAEVDETTSTSSRLRPSTANRPSSSAERRHSRRIQNRASSDPDPRPQTSWVSSTSHTHTNTNTRSINCLCSRLQLHMQSKTKVDAPGLHYSLESLPLDLLPPNTP